MVCEVCGSDSVYIELGYAICPICGSSESLLSEEYLIERGYIDED